MQSAWTTFARDGNPGWARYGEHQRLARVFDIGDDGGIKTYPEERSRQMWLGTQIEVLDLHG
jgi:para-nitrobenzyl esterase